MLKRKLRRISFQRKLFIKLDSTLISLHKTACSWFNLLLTSNRSLNHQAVLDESGFIQFTYVVAAALPSIPGRDKLDGDGVIFH